MAKKPMMEEEVTKKEIDERKRGGGMRSKKSAGGPMGAKPMERPDRRARGGAMSESSPYSAAGKVSDPDYVKGSAPSTDAGGKGSDKTVYSN